MLIFSPFPIPSGTTGAEENRIGRVGSGEVFKSLDRLFLLGNKMKKKQFPFSPTNCWAEWKAVLISQGQRALRSQKPLALVEAAKFNGSKVLSTAPPPSISMDSYFPHFPLTQLGSGEGLLSQVVGFRMPLGRGADAPDGWSWVPCTHSFVALLLGFYHV